MSDRSATTWDAGASSDASSAPRAVLAGRYEVEGLLGVGGMGSVYRAHDRELDEIVALKILRRDLVADPATLDRFRQEVKLARRVTHRNVARTFDIGEHEGERFLTMELVDGDSLATRMANERVLSARRAIEIGAAVCDGLAAAHAVGVVHRDLKPQNVLISREGRVVLTDFGIARAVGEKSTRTLGSVVGTPEYMAPEQVESRAVIDGRADLYALGTMLFEMLTGESAWQGETVFAIAAQRLIAPPPDPRSVGAVSDRLAAIVMKCMARHPADRFSSAEAVASALRDCADEADAEVEMPLALRATFPPPGNARTPVAARTVAILPLRNTGSPEDAPLASTIAETLSDALAAHPALRVRARGEATSGVVRGTDPRSRGRDLGAEVVVETSLRVTPEATLRLVVRVLSVGEGLQLYAGRLDRPIGELFALVDDAAACITEALLEPRLSPLPAGSGDAAVVTLCTQARAETGSARVGANDHAIALLEQAIQRAPDDYWVLGAYANALAHRVEAGDGILEEALEARALAERAVAMAPSAPDPRATLARILVELGETQAAVHHVRAFHSQTAHARLHRVRGTLLADAGRLDAAAAHFRRASMLRPSDDHPRWDEARAKALDGDLSLAEAILDAPPEPPSPNYYETSVRVAAWAGDVARLRAIDQALRARPVARRDAFLGYLAIALGDRSPLPLDALEGEARAAGELPRRRALWFSMAAEAAAMAGDHARALGSLAQADAARLTDVAWLERCPLLARLRDESIFRAVLARTIERASPALAPLPKPLLEGDPR